MPGFCGRYRHARAGGGGLMASSAVGSKKRASLPWVQGLLCGATVAIAPSLAMLFACLLAPGLVAAVLDHQPGRPVSRCVLLCGVAACIEPVRQLWRAGQGSDAVFALVGDLNVLGAAWLAAAAGWFCAELLPILARAVIEMTTTAQAARLRAARDLLVQEWGDGAE